MIKTIIENSIDRFDESVNNFEKSKNGKVFATQTHVDRKEGLPTLYVAVIFYKE